MCDDLKNNDEPLKKTENKEIENKYQMDSISECGGFKTALQLKKEKKNLILSKEAQALHNKIPNMTNTSFHNEFKSALEVSNLNKNNTYDSKTQKKSDCRSITEFFNGKLDKMERKDTVKNFNLGDAKYKNNGNTEVYSCSKKLSKDNLLKMTLDKITEDEFNKEKGVENDIQNEKTNKSIKDQFCNRKVKERQIESTTLKEVLEEKSWDNHQIENNLKDDKIEKNKKDQSYNNKPINKKFKNEKTEDSFEDQLMDDNVKEVRKEKVLEIKFCNHNFLEECDQNKIIVNAESKLQNNKIKGSVNNFNNDLKSIKNKKRSVSGSKVLSKKHLAAKNAFLFGDDDLSPDEFKDQSVNEVHHNSKTIESNINEHSSKNNSIVDTESLKGKKWSLESKTITHIGKRLHPDSKESENIYEVIQDSKRQRPNNEVPEKKTQESITIHRKTFHILKPIVQEFYISSYIPDAAKFKNIFRKIHMDIVERQILGKFDYLFVHLVLLIFV